MFWKSLTIGAAFFATAATAPAVYAAPARNVVLVHGAFADGSGWKAVYDRLVAKGYKVSIVQEPETSLADDVQATRRAVAAMEGPVVLVGHSYGGQVITEAGVDPKVTALVYVAAAVPDVGESIADLFARTPSPSPEAIKPTPDGFLIFDPAQFHAGFAADLPKGQADLMAASQVLASAKILGTKTSQAAWKSKPSYGIVPTLDMANSPILERFMYKRANMKITEIRGASHAVYISRPAEVAAVIEDAANH